MKKLTLGLVSGLVYCLLSVCPGTAADYEQVPGKVTMYNETGLRVSLTIVGQESNLNIDAGTRLPYPFNPNAPTDLQFWYWKDKEKHDLGVVSVFPGDVYVITLTEIKPVIQVERPEKPSHEPDFNDPAAVIADLERMKQEAQGKKAYLAVGKCGYAINTINNFMRLNPEGDPGILRQRWQEAYDEYVKIK